MSLKAAQEIEAHGFPTDDALLIHALVGGSALHGVKLEGADDRDLYGIYIEKPFRAIWKPLDHFVTSTSPQTERNKPEDVDVTCYSLRKFARLALEGNPTILHILFDPPRREEPEWESVTSNRSLFMAKSHAQKYKGYAEAQLQRMKGLKGRGKHGQRPELEEIFGYDTKAGMHVLRLLHEGIEYLSRGWVTLPRPAAEREKLLQVRRGEWSQERVIQEADRLFIQLDLSLEDSTLPEQPERERVGTLITDLYLATWYRMGWLPQRRLKEDHTRGHPKA